MEDAFKVPILPTIKPPVKTDEDDNSNPDDQSSSDESKILGKDKTTDIVVKTKVRILNSTHS